MRLLVHQAELFEQIGRITVIEEKKYSKTDSWTKGSDAMGLSALVRGLVFEMAVSDKLHELDIAHESTWQENYNYGEEEYWDFMLPDGFTVECILGGLRKIGKCNCDYYLYGALGGWTKQGKWLVWLTFDVEGYCSLSTLTKQPKVQSTRGDWLNYEKPDNLYPWKDFITLCQP